MEESLYLIFFHRKFFIFFRLETEIISRDSILHFLGMEIITHDQAQPITRGGGG